MLSEKCHREETKKDGSWFYESSQKEVTPNLCPETCWNFKKWKV